MRKSDASALPTIFLDEKSLKRLNEKYLRIFPEKLCRTALEVKSSTGKVCFPKK